MPTLPKRERKPQTPFATTQNPFYNSRAWRNFSIAYRHRHPLCVKCQARGIITQAQVVDHIVPIRKGADPFNTDNLQSLCHNCHNSKSGRRNKETAQQTNFEVR